MLVLITGGAGFIGSHTVEAALNSGAKVRVLDALFTGSLGNLSKFIGDIEFLEGDITCSNTVLKAYRDVTHVIHLAAQVSVQESIIDPVGSAKNNVSGFLTVLNTAKQHSIKKFVYASSAAVYGIPSVYPITEKHIPEPISPYGLEKYINDQYASLYSSLHGFNCVGMRYFNVYGPRQDPRSQYSGVISKFFDAAIKKLPLTLYGDGQQTRDFIYVKDIARANVAALTTEYNGVINIGTGQSVTLLELITSLERVLNSRFLITKLAERTGDIKRSEICPDLMRQVLRINQLTPLSVGLNELLEHVMQTL